MFSRDPTDRRFCQRLEVSRNLIHMVTTTCGIFIELQPLSMSNIYYYVMGRHIQSVKTVTENRNPTLPLSPNLHMKLASWLAQAKRPSWLTMFSLFIPRPYRKTQRFQFQLRCSLWRFVTHRTLLSSKNNEIELLKLSMH